MMAPPMIYFLDTDFLEWGYYDEDDTAGPINARTDGVLHQTVDLAIFSLEDDARNNGCQIEWLEGGPDPVDPVEAALKASGCLDKDGGRVHNRKRHTRMENRRRLPSVKRRRAGRRR